MAYAVGCARALVHLMTGYTEDHISQWFPLSFLASRSRLGLSSANTATTAVTVTAAPATATTADAADEEEEEEEEWVDAVEEGEWVVV